jgi:serine/threonine protein kinase
MMLDDGTVLDGFRIIRPLGSGTFGHTFEVEGPRAERFALKTIHMSAAEQDAGSLQNEIRTLGALRHRGIPRLVASGSSDGCPYIVMHLAQGQSLDTIHQRHLDAGTTIGERALIAVMLDTLDALSHMNARGLAHRDIKPDNIIVDDHGRATIIDLGSCRALGTRENIREAIVSRFSPPSRVHAAARVHQTHDVFSLGVVCYLLLTGVHPWVIGDDEDCDSLRDEMLRGGPAPLFRNNASVDPALNDFVLRLLRLGDDERPTARAALAGLRHIARRMRRDDSAISPRTAP